MRPEIGSAGRQKWSLEDEAALQVPVVELDLAFLPALVGLACSNLRIVALMAHPAWTVCPPHRSSCRPSSAPWAVTAQMSPVPYHCSVTAVVSPS